MITIHKFVLEVAGRQEISIPRNSKILHVGEQHGHLILWAQVETDNTHTH